MRARTFLRPLRAHLRGRGFTQDEVLKTDFHGATVEGVDPLLIFVAHPERSRVLVTVCGSHLHHELARTASMAWIREEAPWISSGRWFEELGELGGELGWYFWGDERDRATWDDLLAVIDEHAIPWLHAHCSLQGVLASELQWAPGGVSQLIPIALALLGHRTRALEYLAVLNAACGPTRMRRDLPGAKMFVKRHKPSGGSEPLSKELLLMLESALSQLRHPKKDSGPADVSGLAGVRLSDASIAAASSANARASRQPRSGQSDRETELQGLLELSACFPVPGDPSRTYVGGTTLAELAGDTEVGDRIRLAVQSVLDRHGTEEEAQAFLRDEGLLHVLEEQPVEALVWLRAVVIELEDL